ncbi:glycosyltransferase family A protein [Polaribacter marinaquae]|uniref:Glycosyltransferase family A protein n=1 Tax=Polaribacter marinaquae TaxID=1642819 RepID=A0ABZ2TS80_9FLAO
MRIGNNPAKENSNLKIESYHRVVIPVYIPNLTEDYFKDGLKILVLCLESLLLTIHSKTRVTLINNNCCSEVVDYLQKIYQSNDLVDQLLHSKINLGKINAIYAAVKSNLEPLISISDADVMFLPNWQKEVEKIINVFPEAGMVSPVPTSLGYRSKYMFNTIYYALTKGKLKFSDVEDSDALVNFQKSIGREKMYNKQHLSKYLTISKDETNAVIGCGHFVATFRAEVFKKSPNEVCKLKIVGGSESDYFDIPNDKANLLRLATTSNYAYHLGNTIEQWMIEKLDRIKESNFTNSPLKSLSDVKYVKKHGYFIGKMLHKVLFNKAKKVYFSYKGMKADY